VKVKEIILRIVVGGVVVSTFAILADLLKPKSFAGLFGAAPSIALATLFLTVAKDGKQYAAMEGRSMILGALAFFLYAWVISRVLFHRKLKVFAAASGGIVLWFGCAIGLWYAVLR
jgi:hypothetical protein